jgi:hypothetical protein
MRRHKIKKPHQITEKKDANTRQLSPEKTVSLQTPRSRILSPQPSSAIDLVTLKQYATPASDMKEQAVEINVLHSPIDYSFAFFDHIKNYKILSSAADGKITNEDVVEVLGKTIQPVVFCNIHTDMPLNVTSKFDPQMRTLAWASPLEFSVKRFTQLGSSHDYSALLREWTKGAIRDNITFVIIPPGKSLAFCIGIAEVQSSKSETRLGNGVQLRFNHLPEDTVALTTSLQCEKNEETGSVSILECLSRCISAMKKEGIDPTLVEFAQNQHDLFSGGGTIHHTEGKGHGFQMTDYIYHFLDENDTSLLEITPKRVENARKLLAIMTGMAAVKIQNGWKRAKKMADKRSLEQNMDNRDTLKRSKKSDVVLSLQ